MRGILLQSAVYTSLKVESDVSDDDRTVHRACNGPQRRRLPRKPKSMSFCPRNTLLEAYPDTISLLYHRCSTLLNSPRRSGDRAEKPNRAKPKG